MDCHHARDLWVHFSGLVVVLVAAGFLAGAGAAGFFAGAAGGGAAGFAAAGGAAGLALEAWPYWARHSTKD
jgi:hypothetical protein